MHDVHTEWKSVNYYL